MYVCMYACMQRYGVRGAFLSGSICTYRNLMGASSQAHDRLVLSTLRLSGPLWAWPLWASAKPPRSIPRAFSNVFLCKFPKPSRSIPQAAPKHTPKHSPPKVFPKHSPSLPKAPKLSQRGRASICRTSLPKSPKQPRSLPQAVPRDMKRRIQLKSKGRHWRRPNFHKSL